MQLSRLQIWTTIALAGVAGAVVACNTVDVPTAGVATPTVAGTGGVGGFDSPASPSLPSGQLVEPRCPTTAPVAADTCGSAEGTCEYGSNADPACNTVARCDHQTASWVVDEATHCSATCPAHFDESAPGASCSGTDLCTYLEATCGCAGAIDGAWTTISGGSNNASDAGDGGDEASTDGGDAGAFAIGQWQCVRPGHGCPARRPLDGSRCTTEMMSCDYGTCVFGVPLSLTCSSGRWTAETVTSCP